MSNPSLYYAQPLLISAAVFAVGFTTFRSRARGDWGDGTGSRLRRGFAGLPFMIVGGVLGLSIFLGSPSPWKRREAFDHVFRTPPERIERFVIRAAEPNAYRPLTLSEVVIDDAPRIRRIAEILGRAHEFSAYRPHARWRANVTMVTRDGTYHFTVLWTGPWGRNGTLVDLSSRPDGGGWNYGTARADGLETVLEEAVNSARPH